MNDNYTRILQVRLLLIERCLHNILQKMDYETQDSVYILYSFKNTIDPNLKVRICEIINSMFYEINQLKNKLDLESKEISVVKSMSGDLDEIWTTLENTMPEKMITGYGNMTDDDKELLKPSILILLDLVKEIYDIFEKARAST